MTYSRFLDVRLSDGAEATQDCGIGGDGVESSVRPTLALQTACVPPEIAIASVCHVHRHDLT